MASEEQAATYDSYLDLAAQVLDRDVKEYYRAKANNLPPAVVKYCLAYMRGEVDMLALLGFRILWDDDGNVSAIELPDTVKELITNG